MLVTLRLLAPPRSGEYTALLTDSLSSMRLGRGTFFIYGVARLAPRLQSTGLSKLERGLFALKLLLLPLTSDHFLLKLLSWSFRGVRVELIDAGGLYPYSKCDRLPEVLFCFNFLGNANPESYITSISREARGLLNELGVLQLRFALISVGASSRLLSELSCR